jgi:hypothetical protein
VGVRASSSATVFSITDMDLAPRQSPRADYCAESLRAQPTITSQRSINCTAGMFLQRAGPRFFDLGRRQSRAYSQILRPGGDVWEGTAARECTVHHCSRCCRSGGPHPSWRADRNNRLIFP